MATGKFDRNFENRDSKFTNQGYTNQSAPIRG